MQTKCSPRERQLRNSASWFIVAVLIVVGGYQAWRLTAVNQAAQQAVADRINQARRAELIVESATVAMIICDEHGLITSFNPAAEEIFGYTLKEIRGKPVHLLLGASHAAEHELVFNKAAEKLRSEDGNWQFSCRLTGEAVHKDGHSIPVVIGVRGVKYGDMIEFLAVVQPIINTTPQISPLPPAAAQKLEAVQKAP
jgi:PAS domain S-box-containing protein